MPNVSGSSSSSSSDSGTLDWSGPLNAGSTSISTTSDVDTIFPPYRGMEYEESEALKRALSWITVPDARGKAIPVKVWFRLPEREMREVDYPNIIIDYLGMRFRANEAHRGIVPVYYEQNTANQLPRGHQPTSVIFPLPIMLRYQVTTATRNNQHDVMINDILLTSVFWLQAAQITTLSGTVRRLDVISAQAPADSLDKDGKRLFRKAWTIEISSEVVPTYIVEGEVKEIILNVQYPLQGE